MSVNDLLTRVTQGFFLILGALTLLNLLRHRDQARLDVALVFNALSSVILINLIEEVMGVSAPWLSTLGTMALIAQPYLLLRLVRRFAPIPRLVNLLALAGLGLSWLALLITDPSSLPPPALLLMIVYFVGVEGYTAVAFLKRARATRGVAHQRLILASIGTGLVGVIMLLAGVNLALPVVANVTGPFSQLAAVLAGLSYYLGFVSPRVLRRAWELNELDRFLGESARLSAGEQKTALYDRLQQASVRAIGGLSAATAVWMEDQNQLVFQGEGDVPPPAVDGVVGRAWRAGKAAAAYSPADFGVDITRLDQASYAELLYAVPIGNVRQKWGVLLVFGRGALFPDDDMKLLTLFAEQTATALENADLLAQQRTIVDQLRDEVEERTRAEQRIRQLNEELEVRVEERTRDLQASQHQLSLIYESVSDGIFLLDVEPNEKFRFISINQSFLGSTGLDEDQVVSKLLQDVFPVSIQAQFVAHLKEAAQENRSVTWEEVFEYGGIVKYGNVSVTPILDEKGTCINLVGTVHDITERKRAEEALRERGEYLENLLESAPGAIVTVNKKGDIQTANARTEELFGYARDELVGQPIDTLLPERARSAHSRHLTTYFERPEQRPMGLGRDLAGRRKDGTEFPVEVGLSFAHDEDETIGIAFVADITERKQVQEKIKSLNKELEERVARRTVQLEAANRELEAFSYSVSHDLRAPLRTVDGFSRILLEESGPQLSSEAQRYLNLVREGAQQMGNLIDDLLAFSRLGRQPLRSQHVQPEALARRVLADLESEQEGRQVEIVISEMPACQGDPALLTQVYVNLLGNALKFTRKCEVAQIEIGYGAVTGEPAYYVKDNGAGFDMKYADKLFGVFQRLHRSEEYEGTGVGLATVQRIIHRHGGRIWVDAAVDQGAAFYFTLDGEQIDDGE